MKKLLLSAVVIAVSLCANAQAGFGLKGGLNVANLSGDNTGLKSKVGFHVGGFVNIPASSSFAIQPELLFSTEGAKVEGGEGNINLGYINLPIMLQYKTNNIILEAGPQIGFLTSAKVVSDGESEDFKSFLKSSSLALNFGVGYQLETKLGLHARYSLGLSNIAKNIDGDKTKIQTSVISLGLSYQFGSSKKD